MNKILFSLLITTIIVASAVFVLAFKPDDYYIKKQGNTYHVYKKIGDYSTADLNNERLELLKRKNYYELLINETNFIYEQCLESEGTIIEGDALECEFYKEGLLSTINSDLLMIDDELTLISYVETAK